MVIQKKSFSDIFQSVSRVKKYFVVILIFYYFCDEQ